MLKDAICLSERGVKAKLKESVNCTFYVNVHDIFVNGNSRLCSEKKYFSCVLYFIFLLESYNVASILRTVCDVEMDEEESVILSGMKDVSWRFVNLRLECDDEAYSSGLIRALILYFITLL